jgi:hypothetical protein
MFRAFRIHAFFAAALTSLWLPSCDNAKPSPFALTSAQAETALNLLAASVAAAAPRKSVNDLVTPPLTPPPNARAGAEGVSWQLLKEGNGVVVGEGDAVQAELSVWTDKGELAFSSYQKDAPVGFNAAVVPEAVFRELRKVSPEGKAWFWFSAALVHRIAQQHRSFPFPDTALVMEYEVVAVTAHRATAPASVLVADAALSPPDAAGPPAAALVTPNGLQHVPLRRGAGTAKPTRASKLRLLLTVWPITGLVVGQPTVRDLASATTLALAPAGLGQVLQTMTEGAIERVWLPPGKASQVVPVPKEQQAVLDLTLQKIE